MLSIWSSIFSILESRRVVFQEKRLSLTPAGRARSLGRMRTLLACLVLAACTPAVAAPDQPPSADKPRSECCAIAPRAKCGSELLRQGVTQEEVDLIMGPPEKVCPTDRITETRLRYSAGLQGPDCKAALGYDVLATLNAGKCPKPN
jgi:hypothetical protein